MFVLPEGGDRCSALHYFNMNKAISLIFKICVTDWHTPTKTPVLSFRDEGLLDRLCNNMLQTVIQISSMYPKTNRRLFETVDGLHAPAII